MQTEIITTLISSIIGGLLVAIANHLFTRKKTNAEIEKLKAETQKLIAEAEKIRSELGEANYYGSTKVNEIVVYDGTQGFQGYEIAPNFSQYTIQEGVLVIQDSEAGLELRKYTYNGKVFEFIPKNELIAGKRKFHISCEMKVIRAPYEMSIFMWDDLEKEDSVDDRVVTVTDTDWAKIDLYFSAPPDRNYVIHILAQRPSGDGSVQIRNLVVAERIN